MQMLQVIKPYRNVSNCVGYVKLWLAASSPFGSLATAAGGAAGKKMSGY